MIRVLQVVTYMGRGGLESMIMNYYRHIDRDKVQFDFLVHRQERAAFDDEIEALGGKVTGSVTGKTVCLINNDSTSNSAKNKKARELGIAVLTEEEFMEQYLEK